MHSKMEPIGFEFSKKLFQISANRCLQHSSANSKKTKSLVEKFFQKSLHVSNIISHHLGRHYFQLLRRWISGVVYKNAALICVFNCVQSVSSGIFASTASLIVSNHGYWQSRNRANCSMSFAQRVVFSTAPMIASFIISTCVSIIGWSIAVSHSPVIIPRGAK